MDMAAKSMKMIVMKMKTTLTMIMELAIGTDVKEKMMIAMKMRTIMAEAAVAGIMKVAGIMTVNSEAVATRTDIMTMMIMVAVAATVAMMKVTSMRTWVMRTKMMMTTIIAAAAGTTTTKMIMTVAAVEEEDPEEDLAACPGKKFGE